MAERELTAEQKEFISSLAVDSRFARNVSKLREVKNAMLEGMSIENVKQMYLSEEKENPNQDPRAALEAPVMETADIDLGADYFEIEKDIKMETVSVYTSEEARQETTKQKEEKMSEDTSQLLLMAQEAVQQLNEIKIKYEIMDEFIHKHVLEEKNQEISNLHEENRRLKEELSQLQNAIRAAPIEKTLSEHRMESPKKKQKKFGVARFFERGCSENYIVRLFSNPKFTAEQIAEIRLGLEADLSESQIKTYAKHEISARQMREIRMLYEAQNKKQERSE